VLDERQAAGGQNCSRSSRSTDRNKKLDARNVLNNSCRMATLTPRPGLRERKAAELKIRLVDLLTEELREKGFHEVSVEDLSDKALISKVTFYRYFPTKDALLWFHDSVWTYRVKAECLLKGLEGVEALRFLFRDMARELDRNVNLFAYFFGISSLLIEGEERVELTDAEKLVLHPDGSTLGLEINYSLGHFFRTHVERARRRGRSAPTSRRDPGPPLRRPLQRLHPGGAPDRPETRERSSLSTSRPSSASSHPEPTMA
jgi:AcrR family transcriptional regulator